MAATVVQRKQTVEQLISGVKKMTEQLRVKLLQSFLEDTWEEISDDYVSSTGRDKYHHLSREDQNRFFQEEKHELEKRDDLLIKFNEHILKIQVANLREELRNGQMELEEIRQRYGGGGGGEIP